MVTDSTAVGATIVAIAVAWARDLGFGPTPPEFPLQNPVTAGLVALTYILVIALLIFGSRLPSVMRSLGRSVNEFKKGVNEVVEATDVEDAAATAARRRELLGETRGVVIDGGANAFMLVAFSHRILEAAVNIFADHGFHQATVSQIAKEAGVADGTIYLYFKNKEDLLVSTYLEIKQGMGKAMLEGFDEEWNDIGTSRTATYTNLDHGEYVFRVIGSNNDGNFNTQGLSFHFTILPPFWKTWWFYSLEVLIGFFLIFIFIFYIVI